MRKKSAPPQPGPSPTRQCPSGAEPDSAACDPRAGAHAIETDPVRLAKLARRNERAHLRLRRALKMGLMPSRELDALFHRFHAEVSAAVDCTHCANCCVVSGPVLQPVDVERLARRLGLPSGEFRERYLCEVEDGDLMLTAQPCPFLENKRCGVYEDRPIDCRSYPHLDKKEMLPRLGMVIDNAQICPIAYEVLERVRRASGLLPK